MILKELDLAQLRSYEQARDLSIDLLKKWLVSYKFKNWNFHATNPKLKGKPVTPKEKSKRAEQVASILNNARLWLSHGRYIGIETLRSVLRLKIDDLSADPVQHQLVRDYNDMICDYIAKNDLNFFLHSRVYI